MLTRKTRVVFMTKGLRNSKTDESNAKLYGMYVHVLLLQRVSEKMYVHSSMSYSFYFYGSFWIKLYYAYALMMTSYMHVFCVILAIKICITKTCSSVRSGDLSDCAIVENFFFFSFFLGFLHTQEEVSTEYSEHWWCKSKVGEARFVFCVVHARQTQWRNKIPLVGWK